MTQTQDSPKLFLHLTKTAGGTLKAALADCPDLKVDFIYGPADETRVAEAPVGVDLVYGHMVFGIHEALGLRADQRYMCFMRHPVSRVVSHYHHLRHNEPGHIGEKIRASSDINDFFANHEHWEFTDFMCRIVSGLGYKSAETVGDLFAYAKAHIDAHYAFVGFQEFFPLSMRALEKALDARLPVSQTVNVGRYDLAHISEQTLQRIEDLNQADLKLYKYCLERYL